MGFPGNTQRGMFPRAVTAASLLVMDQLTDTNAAIWKSEEGAQYWTAKTAEREQKRAAQWRFMGELLPFGELDEFTFLDLGAGTGNAARGILELYPRSSAILTDFSAQMMDEGEREMQAFAGRFQYLEFDMSTSNWPDTIPAKLDAIVTSMCIHHLPDHRKQGLFTEIFGHLAPGGWYINYDPVSSADTVVEATWERVNDSKDPEAADKRLHRTPLEQSHHENHVRYVISLDRQLDYLRSAGFQGVDVYWKHLENVIYAGCRPT
jgi:tRNA (cmo5U34)-methyltransferase